MNDDLLQGDVRIKWIYFVSAFSTEGSPFVFEYFPCLCNKNDIIDIEPFDLPLLFNMLIVHRPQILSGLWM